MGAGSVPGVAAAWTPADLGSTMKVWLKDSGLSGVDGDPISTWSDSSGNANHFTQGTAAQRPVLKTAILNGKNVARFDATDDGLLGPYAITTGNYTVAVVYNYQSMSSVGRRAVQGSNNWLMGPYTNLHRVFGGTGAGFVPSAPAVTQNVFVASMMTLTTGAPGTCSGYVNSATAYGSASATGAIYPGTIGLGRSGSTAEALTGDIAEVVVCDTALSVGDRTSLISYLMTRFGL